MPKLPFIGGIAGIFGLVLEFSNLKSPTSLISKNRTPFKLRRCVLYSIVREAELTVKKRKKHPFRRR
ncbi:hypothetical protein MHC_01590 [Mycoplasma haemocanis str. Illinois]|uniref:Uncharacterized protein n=1 Tax=Mycoplasma haemocanis (strain Illinois) TaxID=1111676 RepID=H6N6B2_MYCHN|nr:hypothetical protein [Mycoplasma haemocanis]AEW45184.1 hypothetical protein MHC_01590 [Mycoplasma haemocanis str. Illinois]